MPLRSRSPPTGACTPGRVAGAIEVIDPVRRRRDGAHAVPAEFRPRRHGRARLGNRRRVGDFALIAVEPGRTAMFVGTTASGARSDPCTWLAASERCDTYTAGPARTDRQRLRSRGRRADSREWVRDSMAARDSRSRGGRVRRNRAVALNQIPPVDRALATRWRRTPAVGSSHPDHSWRAATRTTGTTLLTADGQGDTGWDHVHHGVAIRDSATGDARGEF